MSGAQAPHTPENPSRSLPHPSRLGSVLVSIVLAVALCYQLKDC